MKTLETLLRALTLVGMAALAAGCGALPEPVAPVGTAGATVYGQFVELGPDGTFGSSKGLSVTIQ